MCHAVQQQGPGPSIKNLVLPLVPDLPASAACRCSACGTRNHGDRHSLITGLSEIWKKRGEWWKHPCGCDFGMRNLADSPVAAKGPKVAGVKFRPHPSACGIPARLTVHIVKLLPRPRRRCARSAAQWTLASISFATHRGPEPGPATPALAGDHQMTINLPSRHRPMLISRERSSPSS